MNRLTDDLDSLANALPARRELDADTLYRKARARRAGRRLAVTGAAVTTCLALGLGVTAAPAMRDRVAIATTAAQAPLPATTASPEEVVRAYLRAVDAHDEETARALVASGRWQALRWNVQDWTGVPDVDVLRVEQWQPGGGEMAVPRGWGMSSVHLVQVRLRVEQRRTVPWWPWDDITNPVGPDGVLGSWTYAVVRDPESGRYLVFDQGAM